MLLLMTRYEIIYIWVCTTSKRILSRENQWNCDYQIWLLPKAWVVQLNLGFFTYSFLYLFLAISDAVRTSLGPRGMDKMVYIPVHY